MGNENSVQQSYSQYILLLCNFGVNHNIVAIPTGSIFKLIQLRRKLSNFDKNIGYIATLMGLENL